MDYKKYIKEVMDFPKVGISFKDITPLMQNGEVFRSACLELKDFALALQSDLIVGPESRGFIFGCPIACELGIGFVPIRKPNKLPREVEQIDYELEYGVNTLCIHKDAIKKGQKILIIDDLLATGGTVSATIKLVEKLGGIVVGCGFLVELAELKGRKKLEGFEIKTVITY